MSKVDFRKIIKKRMRKQGINVPELARQAGLNAQTLYNYLSNRSEMTAGNLENIFEILDLRFNSPRG